MSRTLAENVLAKSTGKRGIGWLAESSQRLWSSHPLYRELPRHQLHRPPTLAHGSGLWHTLLAPDREVGPAVTCLARTAESRDAPAPAALVSQARGLSIQESSCPQSSSLYVVRPSYAKVAAATTAASACGWCRQTNFQPRHGPPVPSPSSGAPLSTCNRGRKAVATRWRTSPLPAPTATTRGTGERCRHRLRFTVNRCAAGWSSAVGMPGGCLTCA